MNTGENLEFCKPNDPSIVEESHVKSNRRKTPMTPKKAVRKRIADPRKWQCNIAKKKCQRGEEYKNARGKIVPKKRIKTVKDCLKSCKFHCSRYISDEERDDLFSAFYSLDRNEKKHFILNTTKRTQTKRVTRKENGEESKRQYSFRYFFKVKGLKIRVCQTFYISTLDISQKPVYNVHRSKTTSYTPKPDGRGLSEKSVHRIPEIHKDLVRKHIESFPCVESNLSRSSKKYLDSNLSIAKMYNMFKRSLNGMTPIKESMYRKIFLTEYNIEFLKKKSDRCDVRERNDVAKKQSLVQWRGYNSAGGAMAPWPNAKIGP